MSGAWSLWAMDHDGKRAGHKLPGTSSSRAVLGTSHLELGPGVIRQRNSSRKYKSSIQEVVGGLGSGTGKRNLRGSGQATNGVHYNWECATFTETVHELDLACDVALPLGEPCEVSVPGEKCGCWAGSCRTLHVRLKIGGKGLQPALERSEGVRQGFLCLYFPADTYLLVPSNQPLPVSACLCPPPSLSPSLPCPEEGSLGLRACGACVEFQREDFLEGGDLKDRLWLGWSVLHAPQPAPQPFSRPFKGWASPKGGSRGNEGWTYGGTGEECQMGIPTPRPTELPPHDFSGNM
ncbi:hypothetical protein Cadr_000011988 [Camelus dromedarius]|uniref:Uncharacterized protein n=1 Tax=Camelus dromedarius TaxID=9838 RepID=A0A5N4DPF1_CAMDR|nr:hypothetical protein Cadr_000011988 [Camelus dromedarius]